jgi:ribonuclease BN (tRNA processing enzyme)
VAYQFDSGQASFVFSGDTTYHEPFWDALNAIGNLQYLMIETTFLNHNTSGAEASGHMRPELLARGFKRLNKPVHLLITHMEPGNEDATMAELLATAGEFKPERLKRGQVFEL